MVIRVTSPLAKASKGKVFISARPAPPKTDCRMKSLLDVIINPPIRLVRDAASVLVLLFHIVDNGIPYFVIQRFNFYRVFKKGHLVTAIGQVIGGDQLIRFSGIK